MTNLKKLKTEDFGEAIIFPYKNEEYKISNYNNDYYINMKFLLKIKEKFNSIAPYEEMFMDLNEKEKFVGIINVDGVETLLRFVKVDYLYKFKSIETKEEIKRFMTQVALLIHTNVKQNKYIALTAELRQDVIQKGVVTFKDVKLEYIEYDGLIYFKSISINDYIKKYTNVHHSFSVTPYAKNASPINTKLFEDPITRVKSRYFTLRGIDQALRNYTIRDNVFDEKLNLLNQFVDEKQKVNFKTDEVIKYRNNLLKVINSYKICGHTILIYSLNGTPCFNIKDISRLNLYLGIDDTTAQQYINLEDEYKSKGYFKDEVRKVVFIKGIEKFYNLKNKYNENYETIFILLARHIRETVRNLDYPTSYIIHKIAENNTKQEKNEIEAEKKWKEKLTKKQEEEKRQVEETKQKEKEDMLIIHENGKAEKVKFVESKNEDNKIENKNVNENEWISAFELADILSKVGSTSKTSARSMIHAYIKKSLNMDETLKDHAQVLNHSYCNNKKHTKTYKIDSFFLDLLIKNTNSGSNINKALREALLLFNKKKINEKKLEVDGWINVYELMDIAKSYTGRHMKHAIEKTLEEIMENEKQKTNGNCKLISVKTHEGVVADTKTLTYAINKYFIDTALIYLKNDTQVRRVLEKGLEILQNNNSIKKNHNESLNEEDNIILEIPNLYEDNKTVEQTRQELQVVEKHDETQEQNNIQTFNFDTLPVRTLEVDGEPYFVGKDVADILGYKKPENAIANHVDYEDKTTTLIQGTGSNYKSKAVLINESGLYALIFSSKLESAKRFKRWVTSEVLPQIRKTGSYNIGTNNNFNPQELLQDPNKLVELLEMVTQEVKKGQVLQLESQEMKKELEAKEEELKNTKAEVIDLQKEIENIKAKVSPEGTYTINDIAAAYSLKGSDINKILDKLGVIVKSGGNWLLSKKYMGKGLEKIEYITNKHGHNVASMRWTEKGKEFIENELADIGHYPSNQIVKLG